MSNESSRPMKPDFVIVIQKWDSDDTFSENLPLGSVNATTESPASTFAPCTGSSVAATPDCSKMSFMADPGFQGVAADGTRKQRGPLNSGRSAAIAFVPKGAIHGARRVFDQPSC